MSHLKLVVDNTKEIAVAMQRISAFVQLEMMKRWKPFLDRDEQELINGTSDTKQTGLFPQDAVQPDEEWPRE